MSADIPDDYNIQEAWNKACQAFAQTAKVDLTKSPTFTVDEVLDQIHQKQQDDDEKHNKYRVAKDAIAKTSKFIMLLGGIAAQGASMVFAPSSLCFNAISYLVDVGAKYKRIFSSLAELFRRISDVLERCKIYMRLPAEAVDIALRKIINEELVCFVDICALSIRVMRGNKILTALKVFAFDSDEGVSGQLGRLASLVERESQMRATLGFESQKISEKVIVETRDGTKKVTASVDKLLTFEKKRDADNVAQRLLSNIDNNLDNPSETMKSIQAIFKRHLNDQVQGSGEWLQEDPLYTAWLNTQSRFSILGVAGDEGFGKSFLFTAIARSLQELCGEGGDEMSCKSAAYSFFDHETKDTSLVKALEALAWQIAKSDMLYRKDLGSVNTVGVNQIGDLCNQLFGKSYKTDSTFFLLLDGVDRIDKQHLKEFVDVLGNWRSKSVEWPRFTLRILLTGRTETVAKIKTELGDGISVLDMASKNRHDMVKFIDDRMNKMDNLSGSSEQVRSLREEVLEALTNQTNGDFVNVGLLLDEISGKQRPGEIREILSRSGEDRSDTIARKIEFLNESLSEEDISDLNDLLTWVLFSFRPLSLEELEAVIFLKSREPSLRPLAEKIRDQYSSVFHIAAARVHFVSDSIADFLRGISGPEKEEDEESLKDTGDVNDSEVRIVRRFLESVCDPKLFDKFGFEDFFQRKLKGKTARVGVNADMAHLTIVSACLEVICAKESPGLDPLLEYAVEYFGDHLESADPSLTLPRHKIALGPQLVKVFTDDEVIERWWILSNNWMRKQWLYVDSYADVVLRWLQDSAVTKNIPEEQRKWIKSLSSKSELEADLLEHVGRFLARRWLQSGADGVAFLFDAAHGYISKIENRKDSSYVRVTADPDVSQIEPSHIMAAVTWAQQRIGIEKLDYEENRNLARTLRDYGKFDEAIEQFKITSTLAKENWFSQIGLAECYGMKSDFAAAIETLEATKQGIESGEIGDPEELEDWLVDINNDLAKWNRELGRGEAALAIYENRLKVYPEDYGTTYNLISLLHKEGKHQNLLELLQSLKDSTDRITGLDLLTRNFHEHYEQDLYNEALFASVKGDQEFDIIFQGYNDAVLAAREQSAQERKAGNTTGEWKAQMCQVDLMTQIALLCTAHGTGYPDRIQCAIDHLLRILAVNEIHDGYIAAKQAVICSQLALICFDKAQEYPDSATEYLKHMEYAATFKGAEDLVCGFYGSHPSRILARYHILQGMLKRLEVSCNLDLLSDDDPLNDWQAYNGLAIHFMFAGQDADALAAWSLITPNGDEENPVPDLSGDDAEEFSNYCDGNCGTYWKYADDFYLCKTCHYVQFDKECLDKLRGGTGEAKICSKHHDTLHVPAYDAAERERIGEGNVKVGEEILTVDNWLQGIRKEWGIKLV
ncbi:hypothetical protein N7509_008087 [Penicillium cosmopolitanum]|uniref:Fungal STAND N-terminal Goodbye domain-containing protein n=1 Tax=Penicillium cosmopolitanum TaxID=1131564 RepID=A0A9W9W0C1_9EURO|nr:uncharacterized protein N7509_008087 [Penicillium cosmopolitanum]KAJ5392597.1 hypothetical protein N7509_008087 [Penicillium cosmopolitanum]